MFLQQLETVRVHYDTQRLYNLKLKAMKQEEKVWLDHDDDKISQTEYFSRNNSKLSLIAAAAAAAVIDFFIPQTTRGFCEVNWASQKCSPTASISSHCWPEGLVLCAGLCKQWVRP
ncbi:unnamed protein product [Cuscuta epithymum]|uniref:Uncharacterized protein n=1 Tax=Cuscuta epithymum TaxID=186058 RepID=A0AAV0E959_9ASTE|nr:unnamed protein product [Cuscuta epithymum]CAH9142412.1 unnamed protein product [Cuscuta epithymum]